MANYYPTTDPKTLIGSKTEAGVLTGIELESSYQAESPTEATKTFEVGGYDRLSLSVSYTMGGSETSNTIDIRLEESPDRVNWYQLVNDSTSDGTSTLTKRTFRHQGEDGDTSNFNIILDIAYKYMRISCLENGVAANKGNVYVEYTLSGQ